MVPQIEWFSFVFLEELKTPKKHFEINWPLENLLKDLLHFDFWGEEGDGGLIYKIGNGSISFFWGLQKAYRSLDSGNIPSTHKGCFVYSMSTGVGFCKVESHKIIYFFIYKLKFESHQTAVRKCPVWQRTISNRWREI